MGDGLYIRRHRGFLQLEEKRHSAAQAATLAILDAVQASAVRYPCVPYCFAYCACLRALTGLFFAYCGSLSSKPDIELSKYRFDELTSSAGCF